LNDESGFQLMLQTHIQFATSFLFWGLHEILIWCGMALVVGEDNSQRCHHITRLS